MYSGFLKYFPCAIAEVSHLSYLGNLKHHSDKPLHWDQDKSTDERDCLARHMLDMECSPDKDTEVLEAASVAWRAMANLERILTGKCNYSPFSACKESNEEHN